MRERLEACRVAEGAALIDVLRALERGGLEIALVVDADDRLVGVMTDGDVRRALLGGARLESALAAYVNRTFIRVEPGIGRAEVLDLMKARTIGQVPIVGATGRVEGLHVLHEVIRKAERPNHAVIMAGGRGARLRPITDETPKPMIRIAGRPILERIVLHLVGAGLRTIYVSINHLGEQIEAHFGDGRAFGCHIEYLRETEPLGTAGALSLLPQPPVLPIVVMNGDLITEADVGAMLDFHAACGQAITMAVRRYQHVVPFGCVDVEDDRVVAMTEKPSLVRTVNAGMYVLDPKIVRTLERGAIGMPTVVERAMADGEVVRAFEIETDWIDVGQPDQLKQAREGTA